jgi:uncharacterized membrane protein
MDLSWVHVHLLFNHFPIVGAIFGLLLLIVALIRRSDELRLASYWGFIIVALITILVYIAGTHAEEVAHNQLGISKAIIHAHEEVAQQAFIALEILGGLSIAGLVFAQRAKRTPSWFFVTIVVIGVVATGIVSLAGIRGGMIRHTEVRGELGFLMPNQLPTSGEQPAGAESTGTE